MTLRRAGLVLHGERAEAAECGRWLAETLKVAGVEVFSLEADVPRMKEVVTAATGNEFKQGFDLMFALGGDGTFLRAAALAVESGTPLLGVNLGRVGFLAAIERADLEKALKRILRAGVHVAERTTLEGEIVVGGKTKHELWALNDVSITKLQPGRLVKLGVSIGGEPLTMFSADGVVVATPTGSTAYSFSAGGPIVSPDVDCLVITPVSPHLVFDRSIVAPAAEEITIEILPDPDAVAVSADGHPWVEAPPGALVRLRRAAKSLRVAEVDAVPFWRLVRTKFRLPDPRG